MTMTVSRGAWMRWVVMAPRRAGRGIRVFMAVVCVWLVLLLRMGVSMAREFGPRTSDEAGED